MVKAMTTKIIGTGSYLPQKRMTNEILSTIVDTNDEWITTRTGIKERRIAEQGESIVDMSAKAGKNALENAGIEASEIDLILVATMSSNYALPNIASGVQAILKAEHAVCMDLNAACSGFVYALSTANAYIQAGIYKTVLLIGAEMLSRLVDWKDRGTCILFGDGAGAAIAKVVSNGRMEQVLYSDGVKGACLSMTELNEKSESFIQMNGQEVFRFAVKKVPESIQILLKQSEIKKEDVDFYILHQANIRIIRSVAERLKEPLEKFPTNLEWYGNTSAASIPILLDEQNRKGILKEGNNIILSGFGGGLTWGSIFLQW